MFKFNPFKPWALITNQLPAWPKKQKMVRMHMEWKMRYYNKNTVHET